MGILNYKYYCNHCKEIKYSYFVDFPACAYCGSPQITIEDISELRIDKFSEEGIKLCARENELYSKPKERI